MLQDTTSKTPPASHEVLSKLRERLCVLYPRADDTLRIAEEAGLDIAFISLSGSPINIWHNILREAINRDKVGALVYVVGNEYPNHKAALEDLFQIYQQHANTPSRQIERIITHLLPFDKKSNGNVCLVEIPKLRAHKGVSDGILNWAVEKSAKSDHPLAWREGWTLPMKGDGSPLSGEAVTLLYDLLEWLVIQEIAAYGEHVYAGQDALRPGDDFDHMPQTAVRMLRSELFQDVRPNYLWLHSNRAQAQILKLPPATTITIQPLPKQHGVAAYGKEPVRKLVIQNPAGALTVKPSQIWRNATSNQARSMIRKLLGDSASLYPVETKLLVTVTLQPSAISSAQQAWSAAAYERWLLELQEQLVRHMDWDRYVEADYRRKLIDLWDRLGGEA